MSVEVHGECDPWFELVREVFEDSFARGLERGAAVSVVVDGRSVVDLWGGIASARDRRPWQRDTLVNVYSAGKGIAALCLHRLADRGKLELEAPVSSYWPQFAARDKRDITIEQLLAHGAGLAAIEVPLPHEALYDHATIVAALEGQPPLWQPGDGHGYHAQTFGFLVAELVARVAGCSIGQYVRDELAGPLDADFHFGVRPELDPRIAEVTRPLGAAAPAGQPDLAAVFRDEPDSLTTRAFCNPVPNRGAANTRRWRAAEIPGSNGHGNARGLASIYGAAAADTGLLSGAALTRCGRGPGASEDRVLRMKTRFAGGFMLSQPEGPGHFSDSPGAFGHPGMGGSLGFADPAAGLGFGYTMNLAGASILVGERPAKLAKAVYACL